SEWENGRRPISAEYATILRATLGLTDDELLAPPAAGRSLGRSPKPPPWQPGRLSTWAPPTEPGGTTNSPGSPTPVGTPSTTLRSFSTVLATTQTQTRRGQNSVADPDLLAIFEATCDVYLGGGDRAIRALESRMSSIGTGSQRTSAITA